MRIGQIIKVIDHINQPRGIKELVGKLGLIVRTEPRYSVYDVLVEEKIYRMHLNNLEPYDMSYSHKLQLKPGTLARTKTSEKWGSYQYWHEDLLEWHSIPVGSVILITKIEEYKIIFLYNDMLYSIHNAAVYNDKEGMPYWCDILL